MCMPNSMQIVGKRNVHGVYEITKRHDLSPKFKLFKSRNTIITPPPRYVPRFGAQAIWSRHVIPIFLYQIHGTMPGECNWENKISRK